MAWFLLGVVLTAVYFSIWIVALMNAEPDDSDTVREWDRFRHVMENSE